MSVIEVMLDAWKEGKGRGERKAPHLGSMAEDIRNVSGTNAKHGFLSIYLIRNYMTPCSLYLYVGRRGKTVSVLDNLLFH